MADRALDGDLHYDAATMQLLCAANRFETAGEIADRIVRAAAQVRAYAEIGAGADIGRDAVIRSRARIGDDAKIGAGTLIEHDARVGDAATIGEDVRVAEGAVVLPVANIESRATVLADEPWVIPPQPPAPVVRIGQAAGPPEHALAERSGNDTAPPREHQPTR